ncbi:MAG: type III-B CRISPR module RAMP protein Cmr6 [Clostridia bacterium]|nr:type III-B CRISPR module RAMP protein Cmr6 [Clostridia bacterium]
MKNLNLLFNKLYYEKLGTPSFDSDVQSKNTTIEGILFDAQNDYRPSEITNQVFCLKTQYPGLIVGSGNMHGAGDIGGSDNDINMGFSFDYVTGQPVIAGSSVKGVLRSHFKYHTEAVTEILKDILNNQDITEDDVKNLETAIFNNSDVFLDAVIRRGNQRNEIMGFDYITPHKSPTENPVPIKIIKVLPDVSFEFRFIITDKTIDGINFSAEYILKLFKELLCLFGSGAKTNVGYGMFSDRTQTENETDIVEPPQTGLPSPKPPKSPKSPKPPKSPRPLNNDDLPEWKKKLMGLL